MTSEVTPPKTGWERVGWFIRRDRWQRGFRTREEFSAAADVGQRVLGDLERAQRDGYRPAILAAIERSLGWEQGSIEAIRGGGLPTAHRQEMAWRLVKQILDDPYIGPSQKVEMLRPLVDRQLAAPCRPDAGGRRLSDGAS